MAEHLLIALGEMCPVPNLLIRAKLDDVPDGDTVILETDHYCAKLTVSEEMTKMGHRVSVRQVAAGVWQVAVTKGRRR